MKAHETEPGDPSPNLIRARYPYQEANLRR